MWDQDDVEGNVNVAFPPRDDDIAICIWTNPVRWCPEEQGLVREVVLTLLSAMAFIWLWSPGPDLVCPSHEMGRSLPLSFLSSMLALTIAPTSSWVEPAGHIHMIHQMAYSTSRPRVIRTVPDVDSSSSASHPIIKRFTNPAQILDCSKIDGT